MNIPDDPNRQNVPEEAKGNPVYEQTRQDMPLWCCGRNCGRNSRIVVLVLGLIGIACSIFVCLSENYFSFESLRNDTFYDEAKQQPQPFEYATVANVGIFRYEILEVFEYPWPPKNQRLLFDDLHERELERLMRQGMVRGGHDDLRRLQIGDRFGGFGNGDEEEEQGGTNGNGTDSALPSMGGNETDGAGGGADDSGFFDIGNATDLTAAPTVTSPPALPPSEIPDVLPGNTAGSAVPTSAPSASPTITNPNDIIAETVDIGVVKPYEEGIGQFDQSFTNGQRGAMLAPIFAAVGLFFSLIELCCCTYKCSWLPTALFLYGAFMFQLMTIFLFMSEDFCKYDMDCALGFAGILSVVAVLCYMISQMLVCCTPRPPPFFNCCKKPPVRRKKKKRKKRDPTDDILDDDDDFDEGEARGLNDDEDDFDISDDEDDDNVDNFRDEPDGYVDPYDQNATGNQYEPPDAMTDDDYGNCYSGYDNDTDGDHYGLDDDGSYHQDSQYSTGDGYDDHRRGEEGGNRQPRTT